MDKNLQNQIIRKVETILSTKITSTSIPPQGMDSTVFFVNTENGREYAIKVGNDEINDVLAYKLIKDSGLDIPVAEMVGEFEIDTHIITVTERIMFPLLDSIDKGSYSFYIPSMLENLRKIHQIKSSSAGLLNDLDEGRSWKEILLFKYSGKHRWFNWEETLKRDGLNPELIHESIEKLVRLINQTDLPSNNFSFLHTDFNQRNLFVNPDTKEITGIVDWSEAMFGDSLYDFARVRLFIRHFELPNSSLDYYNNFLQMSEEGKAREEIYFYSQVVDYLTWYSEELNDFNKGRIVLHQKILEEWFD